MADLYIANYGNDLNDGSKPTPFATFAPAKALIEAGTAGQYDVIYLTGTSENITLNFGSNAAFANAVACSITFANSSVVSGGSGKFIQVNSNVSTGLTIDGLICTDGSYTDIFETVNSQTTKTTFRRCILLNSRLHVFRPQYLAFDKTILQNFVFWTEKQIQAAGSNHLHAVQDCYFKGVTHTNGTTPFIALSSSGADYINGELGAGILNNRFEDMDFAYVDSTILESDMRRNNYKNCNFSFFDNPLTVPLPTVGGLVPCNSVAAIESEYFNVFAVTSASYSDATFRSIIDSSFYYPVNEDANYKNRQQGANRYAVSQVTPVANADYTFVTDHYVSNKVSPTPLVYELTATRAGKLRRLELQFVRTGNTEQLSATSGEVEITLEKSTDGVNFTSIGTFLSGIDSTTLEYDLVLEVGKAYRASIQPVGAAFGEIELYGMVGEMLTLEDELSQTDLRENFAAGTVPSKVVTLYNQAHGAGIVGDFTQPIEANQFVLDDGIKSVDGNQSISQPFASGQVFTKGTMTGWLYIKPILDVNRAYAIMSCNHNATPSNGGFSLTIYRTVSAKVGALGTWWKDGVGSDTLVFYEVAPNVATFNANFANKWVFIASSFNSGSMIVVFNDKVSYNSSAQTQFSSHSITPELDCGSIGRFNSNIITGMKLEEQKLYLDFAASVSDIQEIRRADQYYHEHLR